MKVAVRKITVDLLYAEHLSAFAVVATAKIKVVSISNHIISMFDGRYAQ